jgi:hypothetical protein
MSRVDRTPIEREQGSSILLFDESSSSSIRSYREPPQQVPAQERCLYGEFVFGPAPEMICKRCDEVSEYSDKPSVFNGPETFTLYGTS